MLGFCDRLVNLYGPTETTIWSTSSEISADTTGIPIGKPIANTQAYVLDPFQRPVPIGVSGELYLGGVGLSRGYLNRERLTADVFITSPFSDTPDDRLYRTGDRCRWRSDGNIEFLGRMDNQVKLRGFRIELGDVEAALDEHPSVIQNVVLLRKDPPTENRLVAYYVSEDRIELKVSELRSHLLERLPEYMVPSVLISLDRMPLTSTGKIDRRALPAPELSSPHLNDHYQPPRNKIERDIAEIWCDLLSVDRVGVTDDFFEIGGHSLLAAQLFARLESKFGKKLPVSILFQNGTIRQLSELLSDPDDGSDVAFAVTLHPAAGGCPLFLLPGLQGEIMLSLGQALIQQSDGGFPVIGIQPTLPVRDPTQFKNLQSMASCYVKAICKEKPHGPYALTGYSFSGMLAFEVARQLVELGKEVRLLAIIDTGPNRNALKAGSMSRSQWIYQVISNFPSWLKEEWRQFQALAFAKRVALKLRRIYRLAISGGTARKTLDDIFGGSPVSVDKSQQAEVSFEAFCNYLPSAYAGKLTLFRAKTRPLFSGDSEDLGWTPYARTLEILEVSGDHTTIVHPPQLDDLAKQISHILGEEKAS
jgi:thioesterase domain-containing protein/acyl carrier protein